MQTLIDRIKSDFLTARKNKDAATRAILSALVSDCEAVGKKSNRAPTDDECISVLKSFIKRANESIKSGAGPVVEFDKNVCESYLPSQLSTHAIKEIIEGLAIDDDKLNIGKIMSHFKMKYNGRYDGAVVSELARSHFGKQK